MNPVKSKDQIKREKIPTIADVPTLYRPLKNMMIVIPLPEIDKVGNIIIPEKARVTMNEGHVVALGPQVKEIEIGDCITWDETADNKMIIDGVEFALISEASCAMVIKKSSLEKSATET